MLQNFSNPTDAKQRDDKQNRRSKKSLAALSVSVISAAVFFAVLLYSIQFANYQSHRVYSAVCERTHLVHELAFINSVADISFEDVVQYADAEAELSTTFSIACSTSKQDATLKHTDPAPDPDDSSAEVSAEQKNTKATSVKTRESSAPSTSGTSANVKRKVTPYSQKTKRSGQKHFGVGLRFTI